MPTKHTTKYQYALTKAMILVKVQADDADPDEVEGWAEEKLYRWLEDWGYVWDGKAWVVSPDKFNE